MCLTQPCGRTVLDIGVTELREPKSLVSKSEEHYDRSVDGHQLLIARAAHKEPDLAATHSRDLVDHRVRRHCQTRLITRWYCDPEEWRRQLGGG